MDGGTGHLHRMLPFDADIAYGDCVLTLISTLDREDRHCAECVVVYRVKYLRPSSSFT